MASSIFTQFLATEGDSSIAYDVLLGSSTTSGMTFILIPSLGDIRQEYRYLAPLLHANGENTVVRVDLRGMGESSTSFTSYTPEDTGKDIVQLMTHLGTNNCVLIGCSMAAASVVYAAAVQPSQVKALIVISPFIWDHTMPFGVPTLLSFLVTRWTGPWFWKIYYKSLYTLKPSLVVDLDDHAAKLHENLCTTGRIHALRSHIFGLKAPCAAKAPEITSNNIPLYAIYGSSDPDFPGGVEAEMRSLKAMFPDSVESLELKGCGHYPHVESPNIVYESIVTFLKSFE